MNKNIFKAYDIRGLYGPDIDESAAYHIGRGIVDVLGAKRLAVGRDARPHGDSLKTSLIRGITSTGCDVIDLGMITTPMLYYSSWNLDIDGAVAVTASHNPVEYNGVKLCRKNVGPVGDVTGLNDIRDYVIAEISGESDVVVSDDLGSVSEHDIITPYYEHIRSFAQFGHKKLHIVVDCANTMGVLELPILEHFSENLEITKIYCDLDHPYTAHEANPLNESTLDELRTKVMEVGADLGIAYDGDADRVGFVDEKGEIIPMDLATALMAKVMLEGNQGATILYDLRSSMATREAIEESGGVAHECRVGHTFIKAQMQEENALYAGELSGHYYFKANKTGELSSLAAITLLNLMVEKDLPISDLVSDYRRYFHSGEINSEVEDKQAMMDRLKEMHSDGDLSELDGIKISYWNKPKGEKWWFNVRPSNTEPVLRFICEADTKELMEQKRDEILAIIRS
jgi:phosphomannomutase